MNILMLSWRGPGHPNEGGAEQATLEHIRKWQKAGHSVTWFTSSYKGSRHIETVDGITVIRKGSPAFGVQIHAALWYLLNRKESFDIVIDQIHGLPFFTPLYVKTPILAYIHEVAKEVWWMNPWPKPLNLIPALIGTLLESFMYRIFYRRTNFITVSQSTANDLIEWGVIPDLVHVVHNGVSIDSDVNLTIPKSKTMTILFLGAISRDKGIEDALEVFSLVHKDKPSWKFWIAGKSDAVMEKYLHSELLAKKIDKCTTYWGYVSEKQKFKLLSQSHVLLNPSFREGWGLVNIEANSCGTPVVGYKVAGMQDSVISGQTGVLVESGNISELKEAVISICTNERKRERLSRSARKWASKFRWENATKESLDIIQALTNKNE